MAARPKLYRVEGIVLGRRDYGEADRVVICLTREGRMDLLAKGVRKTRSRKAGHLELFARTSLLVSRVKNSWDIISQAEALVLRPRLQDDFQRGTYARYISELVVRFFERESDKALYGILDRTLSQLEVSEAPELLVRWCEQRLLMLAGFRPEWGTCVGEREGDFCQTRLNPRPDDEGVYGIDPERGGALCRTCFPAIRQDPGVRPLSPSALSWLQALQRRAYEDLTQFPMPDRTARELAQMMQHYIAYHLEYRPSTLKLMWRGRPKE